MQRHPAQSPDEVALQPPALLGGESFRHLLFHLVLSHSGWRYAEVCFGETFEALVQGLQGALWELGGVPRVVRIDDLGYLPQGAEESEVLFTLIAERYERRSLGITSNLVFSEWEKCSQTLWRPRRR